MEVCAAHTSDPHPIRSERTASERMVTFWIARTERVQRECAQSVTLSYTVIHVCQVGFKSHLAKAQYRLRLGVEQAAQTAQSRKGKPEGAVLPQGARLWVTAMYQPPATHSNCPINQHIQSQRASPRSAAKARVRLAQSTSVGRSAL